VKTVLIFFFILCGCENIEGRLSTSDDQLCESFRRDFEDARIRLLERGIVCDKIPKFVVVSGPTRINWRGWTKDGVIFVIDCGPVQNRKTVFHETYHFIKGPNEDAAYKFQEEAGK
jgi:hypothetical protein